MKKIGRVFIVLLLCFVGDTACSKSISDHTNQVIGEKNNSKAPGLVVLITKQFVYLSKAK